MAISKGDVLAALNDLNADELKEIKGAIDYVLANKRVDAPTTVELLFSAIHAHLEKTLNAQRSVPFPVVKQKMKKTYKELVITHDFLNSLLEKKILHRTALKQEKFKLYHLYAWLIVDVLRSMELTININAVINFRDQFPSALENAFPGYAQAGLLEKIFFGGDV